jgi:translation initiation factor IF-1
VKTLVGATIGSYAAADKTLILYDSNGIKIILDVTATTKIDLNGTILPLDAAAPLISTRGKKINVGYSGKDAIYITLIAKYTGTVTENNLTARTLGLTVDTLGSTKISYTYPIVEIYGQTSMTYADIVAGDKVTVILNSNQDQVASILLHKNAQLEVVSVTPVGSKLKVKRSDGVIEEWTLTPTVVLQNENGAAINLNALTIGGLINVSFQGNTPVKVKAVPASIFGKVSSVNTSASTINIIASSNAAITKSVGTNPIVMRDNVVLASLASVLVNDRVEIRMDENDRIVVQIVTPVKKTVWKIASDTQTLSVTHSINETDYSYKLDSGVYIHQGTTTLSLSDLKMDDNISLYFLRGKVVEVVKL